MVTTHNRGARAVFLDRDGVLVVPQFRDGRSFAPRRLEDFHLYEDATQSTRRLKAAGFKLIVATNQPDVGNGLVSRDVVEVMHRKMLEALPLDGIEVCYHGQHQTCDCRKPRPGMLLRAAARLGLDLGRSIMVGDRASDVDAGAAAGCTTVFVDLGYAERRPQRPDFTVVSLRQATDVILELP